MDGFDSNILRGIATVVLMIAFLGTWAWAWSRKRKDTFDAAARLPLEDDGPEIPREDVTGGDDEEAASERRDAA